MRVSAGWMGRAGILVTLIAGGSAATARGAIFFTEDFSDNSPGPHLALGSGFGSPTTDFTGDFTVASGTGSRIYLGTDDTDYSTINIIFTASVTMPVGDDPWGVAFFGMGSRDASTIGSAATVGEPGSPSVLAVIRPDSFTTSGGDQFETRDNPDGIGNTSPGQSVDFNFGDDPSGLTHRLRMTWNATTKLALFEMDFNSASGSFVADYSVTADGSNNGFTASNSRLMFGGGNGLTFDDINVIPEPSTMFLLGLGGLVLRRWR